MAGSSGPEPLASCPLLTAKTAMEGVFAVKLPRQDAGRQRSRTFVSCPRPLTSHATAPRKGRQDVGAFREASQPVGGTRAHSLDVHVGHPWPPFTARARRFALQAALASGARSWARAPPTSSNVVRTWKPGAEATGPAARVAWRPQLPSPTATRRQDAANDHQRKRANLGFACFRPKESRAGGPSFP
jgi:hypothetical protein